MNDFEAHLMVPLRVVDSKIPGWQFSLSIFANKKNKTANAMLTILDNFSLV